MTPHTLEIPEEMKADRMKDGEFFPPDMVFEFNYNPNFSDWKQSALTLLYEDRRLKRITQADLLSFIGSDGRSYWFVHPNALPDEFGNAKGRARELLNESKLWG